MTLLANRIAQAQSAPKLRKIQRQTARFLALASSLVAFGLLLGLFGLMAVHNKGGGFTLDNLALYGSYLQGAVGSAWALAGLFFIYVAFLGQRQQLIQQEDQLEDQRRQFQAQQQSERQESARRDAEFQKQMQQLELQQESIKRQNFESAFFQLLNLQNQIVNAMHIGTHSRKEGRECFQYWYSGYAGNFQEWLIREKKLPSTEERNLVSEQLVSEHYEHFYRSWEDGLGHYFRNLYHIIKFVKSGDIEDKKRYTSLVRAQLSKYELFMLFYNCLSSYGKSFKPLVEEFSLLEHLDRKTLVHPSHENFYNAKAFQ